LYCFWKQAQSELESLTMEVTRFKTEAHDGRKLFQDLTANYDSELSDTERAVRFFVLNRITFSGTVDAGGYSQKAFESRFTVSSINRLRELREVLEGVRITNLDYREVLNTNGDHCFVFLDPPYLSATKSKLYGKRGHLHSSFNHEEFAESLKACPHKWLVTYDDSPEIRNNFRFANIYEWELQYGMNNFGRNFAPKGKELFITNYDVEARRANEQVKLAFES
ncbi:MAG: DNA adenine methylase, partial [Pyrinomonadaceae bacterium]|nr:DNA adenine methylase [Pyrinomonadaceae bacterium]